MFDEAKAQKTIKFIENLKHTKGTFHGQNFKLLPWQEQIIRDVFGTVKDNGYRQYNTAYVEIPKKNGKSELAAAIALWLCGTYVRLCTEGCHLLWRLQLLQHR